MKYYEVKFSIAAPQELMQDARDLTSALAGEAGFETFEETEEGVVGYVQQTLFDEEMLRTLLADFPLPGCALTFSVQEAEDKDWNEQWEQEGFEPIVIDGRLAIHDGRHTEGIDLESYATTIEIDAKLAFGTGTHETTRMIVGTLTDLDLEGKAILDCGTGTGILSIAALKLGADRAVGYDIDEWSVDNARHNAVINRVDDRFQALLGDATVLDSMTGEFDIVVANINRNILLADMPRFRKCMRPGATLILSGFYTEDIPLLTAKAEDLGLHIVAQKNDDNWACLVVAD